MKYTLGTGFHDHGGQECYRNEARRWFVNTRRFTNPVQTVVVSQGASIWPNEAREGVEVLSLNGDVGYVQDLIQRRKPHHFNGGECAIMTLALIAYTNETDLLFQEQDCLAFGPFVERMYSDLGSGGIVHGPEMRQHRGFIGFSLFLIRHSFIPEFVRYYLGTESGASEVSLETKILRMDNSDPSNWKPLSFGYDRERPINFDDPVFYFQPVVDRHNPPELVALRVKGLL